MTTSLPSSYSRYPYQDIRISHVPPTSPTPTPVILITLYRPSRNNAFTELMAHELIQAFKLLSMDSRIKAIVVTGSGKMFCPGADLTTGLRASDTGVKGEHRDSGGEVALAIQECTKPVIAAINGSAVGVGITMTLPMNIRVVSKEAKIGFVFARRGIVMEACSSFYLPRLIGYGRAMHLVTTGGTYASTSPLFGDLFSEVVESGEVLNRALEIANEVAMKTSTVSTRLMKDMIWRGPDSVEENQLLTSRLLEELFQGRDKMEGVNSFMEKREPVFEGTMEKDAPSVWPWWRTADVGVTDKKEGKAKL